MAVECRSRRGVHLCWSCASFSLRARPGNLGLWYLVFLSQHYILGSWYKPEEIGRRAAIFSISGQAASLFSGPMQSESTCPRMPPFAERLR